MTLSEDRINFLSHEILRVLRTKGGAQYLEDRKALAGVKQSIHEFGALLDVVDTKIRQKISSLKRQIPDGSREWDLLYRQYFDEEMSKKGL